MDDVWKLAIGLAFGLGGKIIYDWLQAGRVKAGVVLAGDCEHRREVCATRIKGLEMCLNEVKRSNGLDAHRLDAVEKSLERGRDSFDAIRKELAMINSNITRLLVLVKENDK